MVLIAIVMMMIFASGSLHSQNTNGGRPNKSNSSSNVEKTKLICNCGQWLSNYVIINGDQRDLHCPDQIVIQNVTAFVFNFQYSCMPNGSSCSPTYLWKLTDQTGNIYNGYTGTTVPIPVTISTQGTYYMTIFAHCGGSLCDSCVVRITYAGAPEPCSCKPNNIIANLDGNIITPNTLNNSVSGYLNSIIGFNLTNISCTPSGPNCNANYTIDKSFNSDPFVSIDLGSLPNSFQYTCNPPGNYCFRVIRYCGTTSCDTNYYYVSVGDQTLCKCVISDQRVKINVYTSSTNFTTISCGTTYIEKKPKSIKKIVIIGYGCNPNDSNACLLHIDWEIVKVNILPEASIIAGSGLEIDIDGITLPANYKIIFYPRCGSVMCTPCSINIERKLSRVPSSRQ